jgi:hypothetical protein
MKPETPIHLMLATPAFGGQLTALYASSVLAFMEACQARHLSVEVAVQWGDSLVSRARQDLATRFLETSSATHLLMVDADIGFAPEQAFRLLEFDAEMVSGVYPYKHLDLERMKKVYEKKTPVRSSEIWSYGVEFEDPSKITMKNGFAQALYAGLGFTLIRKSVFQKMIGRYPELKYTGGFLPSDPFPESANRYALFNDFIDETTGRYLSEDRSFCRRWTQMGGEIWVDAQSRLQHVGPTVFDGDFSTQFNP